MTEASGQIRYGHELLLHRTIPDLFAVVGSSIPRDEMRTSPHCALCPRGVRLQGGGAININPARVKEIPPPALPFGADRGDFFARGHLIMSTASMPIIPTSA